ncbi:MAG: hypothetical protein IJD40_04940 [Lachnospiraceae bacterium]|nr:hypothetical protein [Lachnospiraceae bacterium]
MEGMVFEQMCQTKQLYGKVGGRQGYHFVLSLAPGEGTVLDEDNGRGCSICVRQGK